MDQKTSHLTLNQLITLIESNYGLGRTIGENEVRRIIGAYRELLDECRVFDKKNREKIR